jgi:hypothetical protein
VAPPAAHRPSQGEKVGKGESLPLAAGDILDLSIVAPGGGAAGQPQGVQ